MKQSLSILLSSVCIIFISSCASDSASKSAALPPPSAQGATTVTEEVQTSSTTSTETKEVVTPIDSGEEIPLSKLPMVNGHPVAIKTKWPGLVKSPYAQKKQLVDVSEFKAGDAARCPHTGKAFIVP
jgi:hypothetical protein